MIILQDKRAIHENLEKVTHNIDQAARKSGRTLGDINLVVVTKTIDVDKINHVYEKGFHSFGENRVQELNSKYSQFNEEINWHLIGHLQRNKVKDIIDKVQLIHSVDSIRLMKEINKQASKINRKMPILVQTNVAEEESKFGIKIDEIEDFIEKATQYENILVKGLMTIAPYEEDAEKIRPVFTKLKEVYDTIKKKEDANIEMEYLSMGMTNDYVVAIEEGSNMVRIGTGIFGKRDL